MPIFLGDSSDLILKKGEMVNLTLTGVTFKEPRAVRRTSGGGGGTSFRVAKGVTIRTGTGNSKSESTDEIKNIDTGTLTISTKRIVFSGNIKTITIDLNKIINLTPYTDGIATRRSNKQKTEYFTGTQNTVVNFTYKGEKISIPADGVLLQAIIKHNINNL